MSSIEEFGGKTHMAAWIHSIGLFMWSAVCIHSPHVMWLFQSRGHETQPRVTGLSPPIKPHPQKKGKKRLAHETNPYNEQGDQPTRKWALFGETLAVLAGQVTIIPTYRYTTGSFRLDTWATMENVLPAPAQSWVVPQNVCVATSKLVMATLNYQQAHTRS